jgi:hypothetical protein
MSTTKKTASRFKVGDWVSFRYGTQNLIAQVIEARGPLGVKGRHLYRICMATESGEPDSFELPEDELHPASPPARPVTTNSETVPQKTENQYPPGRENLPILVADLIRKYKEAHPDERDELAVSPPHWYGTPEDGLLLIGRSVFMIRDNKVEKELRKAETVPGDGL